MAITVKYNNIPSDSARNFVCFSDVPNLVEVDNSADGFVLAMLEIEVIGFWASASHTDPWYITINGETITGVDDYKNAINKNFFISNDGNSSAASIAKALRNCPSLATSFTIRNYGDKVELLARNKGAFTWNTETNAPLFINFTKTNGTVSDELIGGKVSVNVLDSSDNFITSVEKNYYQSGIAFDMTPVLSSLVKPGKTTAFNLQVSATKNNGTYMELGEVTGNSITQGYMVNQGFKYLPLNNSMYNLTFAQNVSRGTEKGWYNNTNLYVYGNTIPLCWYHAFRTTLTVVVDYLTSSLSVITSTTVEVSDASNGWLHNTTIQLSQEHKNAAHYIRLTPRVSGISMTPLVYNVIKPLKAAEYYQRVYWRNSYGGISFFDFTGSKSESREVETITYDKNVYEYYTQYVNEKAIPYDTDVKYSVTLKSHLFDKDGTYLFNDLIQSPEVWIETNGEEYRVIIDTLSVDEDNMNNLYTATIKYHLSANPTL